MVLYFWIASSGAAFNLAMSLNLFKYNDGQHDGEHDGAGRASHLNASIRPIEKP